MNDSKKVEVSTKLVSKSNVTGAQDSIEKELKKRVIKGLFDFNLLNFLSYQKKVAIAYKMMKGIGLPITIINDEFQIIPVDILDEQLVKKVILNQMETDDRKTKVSQEKVNDTINSEGVIQDDTV